MEELQSITNNSQIQNKMMKGLTVDTDDDKIGVAISTPTSLANDSQLQQLLNNIENLTDNNVEGFDDDNYRDIGSQ